MTTAREFCSDEESRFMPVTECPEDATVWYRVPSDSPREIVEVTSLGKSMLAATRVNGVSNIAKIS